MGLMQGKRTPWASPITTLTATNDHALSRDAGTDTRERIPDSSVDAKRTRFVPNTSARRPPRTCNKACKLKGPLRGAPLPVSFVSDKPFSQESRQLWQQQNRNGICFSRIVNFWLQTCLEPGVPEIEGPLD